MLALAKRVSTASIIFSEMLCIRLIGKMSSCTCKRTITDADKVTHTAEGLGSADLTRRLDIHNLMLDKA